jgi:hypothetical protein
MGGREVVVMSSPIHNDDDRNGPSMYAPRWARRTGQQEEGADKSGAPAMPSPQASGSPMQGSPIPGGPIQGGPIPGGPMQGAPMQGAQVTRLQRAPHLAPRQGERGPLDRNPLDRGPAERGADALRAINFDDQQFEGDVAVRQLMLRQTLDPQPVPPPPVRDARDRGLGMAGRFMIAAAIAAIVAFVVVSFVSSESKDGTTTASLWGRLFGGSSSDQASAPRALPRLFVENRRSVVNQPIGLGIQLSEQAPGAFILMRGLASGTRLNAGTPVGEGSWRIPTRELSGAAVLPPMNFAGPMEISIDLRLPDDTVADSNVVRLEWVVATANVNPADAPSIVQPTPAPPPQPVATVPVAPPQPQPVAPPPVAAVPPVATVPPPVAAVPPPAAASRSLDSEEMAAMLKRGESFIATGDIAAARLLLRRVAEAGNARAALALGATYDPAVLKQIGILGAAADVKQARTWYEKAAALGSPEAPKRLEQLAQQAR